MHLDPQGLDPCMLRLCQCPVAEVKFCHTHTSHIDGGVGEIALPLPCPALPTHLPFALPSNPCAAAPLYRPIGPHPNPVVTQADHAGTEH